MRLALWPGGGGERVVDSGHHLVKEMPDELGALIADWLVAA